jgi:AhpD family alkylhydroperoxidase
MRGFGELMRSVSSAGTLDERTKELIAFACVLVARCERCLAAHMKKALAMGISQEELDEAAWCAIAMGGAPVRMFYEAGKKR